jgi:hypothetical protein
MAAIDMHAAIELLEAVFSMGSIPKLCNEEQLRIKSRH